MGEKEDDAYDAEEFWISFFCSDVTKHGKEAGYNVGPGGLGAHSGISNPMFGKHHTEAARLSMSQKRRGSLNPRFGKKASANTKNLISESKKKYTGERNHRAKLTNTQAEEIRNYWQAKTYSINEMSVKYGVHRNVIERIIRNETYRKNK